MIFDLARRIGDCVVLERIEGDLLFEGGAAQVGVLATFEHDGSPITGRVVSVVEHPDSEASVEIELIDQRSQDVNGEVARENLPPDDDTHTKI
jgi:hypothetical protein